MRAVVLPETPFMLGWSLLTVKSLGIITEVIPFSPEDVTLSLFPAFTL